MIPPVVVAAAFLAGAPAVRPSFAPRQPLQIAVEDAADLWSRPDGTGFANDLVRAAFRAVDIDVQFIVVPYARCKKLVVDGTAVACFSMSPSTELKGAVQFPAIPLFLCYTELVGAASQQPAALRLADLPRGTIVGTVLGYEYPDAVQQAVRSGAITLDPAPSEGILLRKLASGRLRAALINVNDSKPIEFVAAMAGVAGGFHVGARVGTLASYIGFSVRHPQGASSRDAYDRGMRKITANGVLKGIVQAWADSSRVAVHVRRRGTP